MKDHICYRELFEPLPSHISFAFVQAVVAGIRRGHHIVASGHDVEAGYDAHTYGTNAWRLSHFHVEEQVLDLFDSAKVTRSGGVFRIWYEGSTYSVYASGSSDRNWSVFSYDFEGTSGRIEVGRANDEQLTLFDMAVEHEPDHPDDPANRIELTDLSFVYVGSPDDGGCAAIYLGAPLIDAAANGPSWSWVRCVYSGSGGPTEDGASTDGPSKFGPHDGQPLAPIKLSLSPESDDS